MAYSGIPRSNCSIPRSNFILMNYCPILVFDGNQFLVKNWEASITYNLQGLGGSTLDLIALSTSYYWGLMLL